MDKKLYSFAGDVAAQLVMKATTARKDGSYINDDGIGFKDLDYMIAGLQRGNLIIVGGRPAMGKTAFALSIASNLAIHKKRNVVFFSVELSKEAVVSRIIATKSQIDFTHFRTGQLSDEEWNRLCKCAEELGKSRLIVDDTPEITIDEICDRCLQLKELKSVDIVLVDYLQIVSAGQKAESRQLEVEYIVRKLKKLAKEINVPILVISQLSRAIEQRSDKHPMLSDFRETSAIEQEADTVMFIYRDDYYCKDSKYRGLAEIMVEKNKTGNLGSVYLEWDSKKYEFRDLDGMLPSETG